MKEQNTKKQLRRTISKTESDIIELQKKTTWKEEDRALAARLEDRLLESKQRLRLLEATESESPEPLEIDHPQKQVKLRRYVDSALSGSPLSGAEAELDEELSMPGDSVYLPVDVLFNDVESRADVNTTSPGNISRTQSPALPRIFPSSVAAYLGVSFPSVPAGERSYVLLTAGVEASAVAEGAAVESTAASFSTIELTPKRIAARYTWTIEGISKYASLESVLRRDLQAVMTNALDQQILYGTGTGGQVEGFLSPTTDEGLPAVSTNFTVDATTWSAVGLVGKALDGVYAESFSDCRFLFAPATVTALASSFSSGSTVSAYDYIASKAQTRISNALKAVAGNAQEGILFRGRHNMNSVAPVWRGIRLIKDPYSGSASGVSSLTAHMLFNFAILRESASSRLKFTSL